MLVSAKYKYSNVATYEVIQSKTYLKNCYIIKGTYIATVPLEIITHVQTTIKVYMQAS